jgi:hypothetical protein
MYIFVNLEISDLTALYIQANVSANPPFQIPPVIQDITTTAHDARRSSLTPSCPCYRLTGRVAVESKLIDSLTRDAGQDT